MSKALDHYLRKKIIFLKKSAKQHRHDFRPGNRRFGLYDYLTDVYAVFLEIESRDIERKAARQIIKLERLSINKRTHPFRVLIEATAGREDAKQKSRWSRALQFVLGWHLSPERLKWCLKCHGGISGAAKKQAINEGKSRPKIRSNHIALGDQVHTRGEKGTRSRIPQVGPHSSNIATLDGGARILD
jgi:hypothetical protein